MGTNVFELHKFVVLDETAIEEIRKAVIAWYYCEEGAPAIHPSSPMAELLEDGYMDTLLTFIRASGIDRGPRKFRNPLLGLPPYDRRSHGIPPFYFDGEKLKDEIEIDITVDHLKLILAMRDCDWTKPDRPAFDPKRVFNDHRDAAEGAREVLAPKKRDEETPDEEVDWDAEVEEEDEDDLTPEDREKYTRLWRETAAVLQVIVREAEVEPGVYVTSLFGGFKKLADTSDFALCRKLHERMGEGKLSRKTYVEMVRKASQD